VFPLHNDADVFMEIAGEYLEASPSLLGQQTPLSVDDLHAIWEECRQYKLEVEFNNTALKGGDFGVILRHVEKLLQHVDYLENKVTGNVFYQGEIN
jgi:hypothetical protein